MELTDPEPSARRPAYTIDEAADRLTIHRSSLYRLINDGTIRVIKIGHRTVVPAEEIDRLLAEGTQ